MLIVHCLQCGKEFVTKQCRIKTGRGKFCSRTCLAKFTFTGLEQKPRSPETREKMGRCHKGKAPPNKGELVKCTCQICGKCFEVWPSRFKKCIPKYCSRSCQHESKRRITGTNHLLWKREQKACEWCGKVVWVKHCKLDEFRYCSRKCMGTATAYKMSQLKGPTSIELALMNELDECGIDYKPQYRIAHWLVDIAIPEYRTAIEADGDYWHSSQKQKDNDAKKNHWLEAHKWKIFRFTEHAIRESAADCIQCVISHIKSQLRVKAHIDN